VIAMVNNVRPILPNVCVVFSIGLSVFFLRSYAVGQVQRWYVPCPGAIDITEIVFVHGKFSWIERRLTAKDWEYGSFYAGSYHQDGPSEVSARYRWGDVYDLTGTRPEGRTVLRWLGLASLSRVNPLPRPFNTGPAPVASVWTTVRGVTVPLWPLVVAVLSPSLLRLRRRLRKTWRLAAGQCAVCGFDMRATPGRCPECGTVPVKDEVRTIKWGQERERTN
jgi:hypothetical protein